MRHSHADAEVEAYLRKAERDLATAVRMSEAGLDFADVVCFHAQQCAEKSLKAVILAHGQIPPRTHDLIVLQRVVQESHGIAAESQLLERFCVGLTDYGVAPRYPGWEDLVGNVDLAEVVKAAKAVLDRALAWLNLTESA